jgi:hypothetical protein
MENDIYTDSWEWWDSLSVDDKIFYRSTIKVDDTHNKKGYIKKVYETVMFQKKLEML